MRRACRLVTIAIIAAGGAVAARTPAARMAARVVLPSGAPAAYVVPVDGVRAGQLRASFGAPRAGGRRHHGIDIVAPRGTRVVAAAEGFVVSTTPNRRGGTVVWVLGAGWRLYYYAHLDGLAAGVRPGAIVHAGDLLGRVGTTGNAAGGPAHLHFGVYASRARFLAGGFEPVDPLPLLRAAKGATAAA
jgi:murein DD-endopeptidase MepM/ murein hydrolase activator NlpD